MPAPLETVLPCDRQRLAKLLDIVQLECEILECGATVPVAQLVSCERQPHGINIKYDHTSCAYAVTLLLRYSKLTTFNTYQKIYIYNYLAIRYSL